jgi:hypothetical protein
MAKEVALGHGELRMPESDRIQSNYSFFSIRL